ncbi:hypothetical protein [Bacillus pseudomycoides]|uniref:hypothetical protein n=1 Tax=Bacillus pseudomycoides TaxID=64104 RepID=UPI000BECB1FF|nr:hypothetical protein [Bacillus pseudomycoides]MED1622510.1 hypothetical protein [Bacillus pseudomycoides]PEF21169.1 hypothetical protein CON69_29460 [Bacillus pseudomycoides]PGD74273.1 hypothetical protein COM46_20410 [Bacillus pseudomycoides]
MKRKYLAKAGVFALAAGIILPSTVAHGEALPSSVSASTANVDNAEIDDVSVEVYDKDRNLVKTYSKEELEKFNQDMAKTPLRSSKFDGNMQNKTEVNSLAMNVYNFGYMEFSNYQWIKDGTSFYLPQSVQVEPQTKTYGLAVQVFHNSSLWEEYVVKGSFSSGLNILISHLLNASGNYYQLRLKNYGGGTIYLDSGQVYYK